MNDLHQHLKNIRNSYQELTGRVLITAGDSELVQALWEAPFALLSHGLEADPVLNYGNALALKLWETDWETFTKTPSRQTARPDVQAARATLLDQVRTQGFSDNYAGIRVSFTGKLFKINQATVWNILDEQGNRCGQAAAFQNWNYL